MSLCELCVFLAAGTERTHVGMMFSDFCYRSVVRAFVGKEKVQISFMLFKKTPPLWFGYGRLRQLSSSGRQEGEMLFLRNKWQGLHFRSFLKFAFPRNGSIQRRDIMSTKQSLTIAQWHKARMCLILFGEKCLKFAHILYRHTHSWNTLEMPPQFTARVFL